ncbi:MAG: hypothetical protein AB7U82_19870 [Blastocatellales bacterium]
MIITTLLALQLFATAGLCGGVCCATGPAQANRGDLAAKDNHEPVAEEKIEGGHCPMHADREARPNPQESNQRSSKTTQRPDAGRHNGQQARSSSGINAHFCACSVKREDESFDALLPKSPEQRPVVQILSGALNQPYWLIESSPLQNISPDSFQPHSPPFSGRQLHLRI